MSIAGSQVIVEQAMEGLQEFVAVLSDFNSTEEIFECLMVRIAELRDLASRGEYI